MNTHLVALRPSEVLRAHRGEVLELIKRRGGRNPRVFGSVARGVDEPASDLDILVAVPPEHAWDFVSVPRELSELLGIRVDVVFEGGLREKHRSLLSEARPL